MLILMRKTVDMLNKEIQKLLKLLELLEKLKLYDNIESKIEK